MRVLECGCTFQGQGTNWVPCPAHVHSQLYKVRKAHAEVVSRDEMEKELEDKSFDDTPDGTRQHD